MTAFIFCTCIHTYSNTSLKNFCVLCGKSNYYQRGCIVIHVDPSGWWTGKIGRKEGLFPSNYVEEM